MNAPSSHDTQSCSSCRKPSKPAPPPFASTTHTHPSHPRYTSKVTLQRPHQIHSSVADSRLFDHLDSTWVLRPGPQPGTTWLVFKVDFAFRSALYRQVADLFFSEVVKRMMGAFEGRCAHLYGPSVLGGGASARQRPVVTHGAAAAAAGAASSVGRQHQRQIQQARESMGVEGQQQPGDSLHKPLQQLPQEQRQQQTQALKDAPDS